MATSEMKVKLETRVATLSSTVSNEEVVQVAARGVAEDSLDHTAQEEPQPKHSASFPSEPLKKHNLLLPSWQGRCSYYSALHRGCGVCINREGVVRCRATFRMAGDCY